MCQQWSHHWTILRLSHWLNTFEGTSNILLCTLGTSVCISSASNPTSKHSLSRKNLTEKKFSKGFPVCCNLRTYKWCYRDFNTLWQKYVDTPFLTSRFGYYCNCYENKSQYYTIQHGVGNACTKLLTISSITNIGESYF